MSDMTLWCLLDGADAPFPVDASPTTSIAVLKEKIVEDKLKIQISAYKLKLWKVNVNLNGILSDIHNGKYEFDTHGEPLPETANLSSVWQQPWPSASDDDPQLHVYITLPADMGSPTLVDTVGQQIEHPDVLRQYEDIFMKVKEWNRFEYSDISRNQIQSAVEQVVIPGFVRIFEKKLDRKPRVRGHMVTASQIFDIAGSYFGASEDMIDDDEDEYLGELRYANDAEVLHTIYISRHYWEKGWQPRGGDKCALKEKLADAMFFYPLIYASSHDTSTTIRRDKCCPITLGVQRESESVQPNEGPRKYKPRSDFLISRSSLPRLLVEVNSTLGNLWPTDLVRMLVTGAFIVRFANSLLKPFCNEKNFVLCAIFIWDNGTATRYSLFQQTLPGQGQISHVVYYNETQILLSRPAGRIELVRSLHNLIWLEPDDDQDMRATIFAHNRGIESQLKESMFTNSVRKRALTGNTPRNDNHAGEGGGDDRAQLRAHGYEVKSDDVVDAGGGEWGPYFKMPDHILTVYRPMESNKEFIAKRVREDSNELEMLRLLDTFPLKSDHVISLIDSFHGWAILPKMVTVKGYVKFPPNLPGSKVSQICLGLVKGLAYLHEHRIAHRDIKPDNLVLNKNFYLKIIDFDMAMRVEDEDQEVDDQCGTKNWMAPEVEQRLRHSPIKADRWACGRVLLFLLDKFGKEDESLRRFARNLMAHNPKHRPSLSEWSNDSALSNVETMEFQRKTDLAASTRPSDIWQSKHEAPECEEAETRWVVRSCVGLGMQMQTAVQ